MSLELLVLGSGGPFANPRRASSGCLVTTRARRLLVDAGGGVFVLLGEQGVDPGRLEAILLTHTHADHSGDLPAVVFAATMAGGARPLRLVGPADIHPGTRRFAELLFGADGAWSYLHAFAGFAVEARELPSDPGAPGITLVDDGEPEIHSAPVAHGTMPSVAYRFDDGPRSLVVTGDAQGYQPQLVELARGCGTLVADFALPERETEHGHLHPKPSEVARLAADAGAARLVLTHVMPEHEDELDASLALVRERYDGEVVLACDGLRLEV